MLQQKAMAAASLAQRTTAPDAHAAKAPTDKLHAYREIFAKIHDKNAAKIDEALGDDTDTLDNPAIIDKMISERTLNMEDLAQAALHIKDIGASMTVHKAIAAAEEVEKTNPPLFKAVTAYAQNLQRLPHITNGIVNGFHHIHQAAGTKIGEALDAAELGNLKSNLKTYYYRKGDSAKTEVGDQSLRDQLQHSKLPPPPHELSSDPAQQSGDTSSQGGPPPPFDSGTRSDTDSQAPPPFSDADSGTH